ncbi:MAG: hypothetical protein GY772_12750, partial [bacterium]|nr:hypothetical protein [bacterium]
MIGFAAAAAGMALQILRSLLLQTFPAAPPKRDLDLLELFAGDQAVSKTLRFQGQHGVSLDVRMDERHDFMEPVGFLQTVATASRLREGAICWAAPACSTWIFLRGTLLAEMSIFVGTASRPTS